MIRTAPGTRARRRNDRPETPAPRQQVPYHCDRGHDFEVTFAAEIEPPQTWDHRCGAPGHRVDRGGEGDLDHRGGDLLLDEHDRHMAQLFGRRTPAELEQILDDRLAEVATARKAGQP